MKNTFTAIVLGLLFVIPAAAQLNISPMKVIYVRPQKNLPDFKQRFEIRYPIVEGVKSAAVKRRIESAISYWKAFDTTLNEDLNEYTWLDSMDYEVAYNENGILDINLIRQGAAAYPDGYSRHVVVDEKTGRTATIANSFRILKGLQPLIDAAQKKEVADKIEELKQNDPGEVANFKEMMDSGEYKIGKLDEFSVSDEGVTFIFDYGFPHAIEALSPDGEYFFSWKEITPFLNSRGPLGRFRVKE